MFIFNMATTAISQAEVLGKTAAKGLSWGSKLIQFGPIKKVVGWMGTPLLVDLKKEAEQLKKKVEAASNERSAKSEKSEEEKSTTGGFWKTIKGAFAYGDLLFIFGSLGWLISGKFLRLDATEDASPIKNMLKGWAKFGLGLLGGAGFIAARIAQKNKLHLMRVLGKEGFAEYLLNTVQMKTGNSIFTILDTNRLIVESENSKLVYNRDEYGENNPMLDVHHSNGFKRYLSGDSGVGKTSGAKLIAGLYAKRKKEKEGQNNVVIKILEGSTLTKFYEVSSDEESKLTDTVGMFAGEEGGKALKVFTQGDPLVMSEAVLIKLESEMRKAQSKGEDLVLIIDEIDSIFPVHLLQEGAFDVRRLELLVRRLQDLMEPQERDPNKPCSEDDNYKLICTSNYNVSEYVKRIPLPEKSKAGFLGRLVSMYVERPNPQSQAEIIANYLLNVPKILANEGRIITDENIFDEHISGAIKNSKQALVKLIYEKVTKDNPYPDLVGRSLMIGIYDFLKNNYLAKREGNVNAKITMESIGSVLAMREQEERNKSVKN